MAYADLFTNVAAVDSARLSDRDVVNHPQHYTSGKIEIIDVMEDQLSPEEYKGYIKGQIIKYVTRERHKNGVEDLRKAQWYLNRYIQYLEKGEHK